MRADLGNTRPISVAAISLGGLRLWPSPSSWLAMVALAVMAVVVCPDVARSGGGAGWDSTVSKTKPGSALKKKRASTPNVAPPTAAKAAGTRRATALRLSTDGAQTTLALSLSDGVRAEIFTLADPYRLVIDLPDLEFTLPENKNAAATGLVLRYRYGLFAEGKARVVVDTSGPVRIALAEMVKAESGGGYVLKVALVTTDAASFGAGTGAATSAALSETAAALEADDPVEPPAQQDRNRDGAAKPVVMIDPGHGGVDPGASGNGDLAEKTVVLAVAQQLKSAMANLGAFDVRMTRTRDVFVSLDRRLKMSREAGADLFISLHADAIEQQNYAESVRGATIYTLSERASDEQARLMAEKENASDLVAGLQAGPDGASDQVRTILIDLLKRETANFSTDFSNVLAARLKKSITLSRSPQRSAAFKVLKQTHAPSVLIELGYMSNTRDQKEMTSAVWQKKVAASIATAVKTYFSKRTAERR